MTITERTAYLKGLLEGLQPDENKPESKLLAAIIETLDDIANDLTDVANDVAQLNDYAEELDEDLADVESVVYDDEEDELYDDDDFECDGDCENCDEDCDDGFYEVTCPHCGETVCFDETCNPRDLICPACQERFDCLDAPEEK